MSQQSSASEEPILKVLAELQRRFRAAGKGAVSRIERELGLSAGYFKDQRRSDRRRFDLKVLFKALEALKVDPAEFFCSVLGAADPLIVFLAECGALRRRKKHLPRILVLEAERELRDAEAVDGELLADLDRLRFEDPNQVIWRARRMMPEVAESLVGPLLGVYASSCRIAGKYDEAMIVLGRGLEIADKRGDPHLLSDLIRRAGYVVASRGQLDMALALAERATLVCVRNSDLVGVGRSLHDQGLWHYHLDHARRALAAMRAAADYLKSDAVGAPDPGIERDRFSCLMYLGVMHRGLGELDAARSYLRQGREHPREVVGSHLYGRLVALQASIARDAGRYARAEDLYRESLEIFQPIAPYDTVLCGLELARVQLRRGRTSQAYDTAKGLMPLVEPLEKNPVASAALTELLRCALAGRGLSEALLQRVAGKFRDGQAPRPQRPVRP